MAIYHTNGTTEEIEAIRYVENGITVEIPLVYVVENGVTALVFGTPPASLNYYGVATNLSVGRAQLAATTIGDYALFGGGRGNSSVVDVYQFK